MAGVTAPSIGNGAALRMIRSSSKHTPSSHLKAARFGRSGGVDTHIGFYKDAQPKGASRRSYSSTTGSPLQFKKVQN
jgi:hypothetical protein